MTSQLPESVSVEQKVQPPPPSSSHEMAVDLDVNGTSHRDEKSGGAEILPSKLPASPSSLDNPDPKSSVVNGTTPTADAAGSISESLPTDSASTLLEVSQIPDSLPTTTADEPQDSIIPDAPETISAIDAAIDAAVEDSTVTSTVPPVVEAPESDLRDSTPEAPPASEIKVEQGNPSLEADLSTRTDSLDIKKDTPAEPALGATNAESSMPPTVDELAKAPEQDTEMTEAPAPTKVAREREDDDDADRTVKRTKTDLDAEPSTTEVNGTVDASSNGEASAAVASDEPTLTPYLVKEIIKHIKNAARTADGKNFRGPVVELWPSLAESYTAKISQPIDLATIERNLRNNVYPTMKEVKSDLKLIHDNAVIYNGENHEVAKSAYRTSSSLIGKVSNIPPEPIPTAKKPQEKKSTASTPVAEAPPKPAPTRRQSRGANTATTESAPAQTFALDPQSNTPLIRRDSTKAESGRPKRDIIPPKNKDLPYSVRPKSKKFAVELRWCQEALAELKKPKYATFNFPFLTPVDPVALGIPTYFSVIKHPMDVSTVESKLDNGLYTTSKDFEKDVNLIVSNCFKFNPPGNPVHDLGKLFDSLWKEQLSKKSKWIADHTPAVASVSPSPESDAEESEEEPEAAPPANAGDSAIFKRLVEEQGKLIEIMGRSNVNEQELKLQQDMVNFLTRQVEAEKVAPPAAKKTKKAKAPKAATAPAKKKGTSAAKPSAPKKSGRKERYLGTLEKEVISMGIGSLPEHVSDTVLTWIQNDRPDLGTEDDGTLELDIDMIATPTLWKIYELVKQHCPEIERDLRQSYEAKEAPRNSSKPATKKKNKPMNKYEQDQKIKQLEGTLQNFERQTSGSQEPLPTVEKNDPDSSGDEDSDSEEE